jgi:hypothetical protein
VWHDAAILRFSQWWKRAERAGHAYAEGASLHGDGPERHFVHECRRAWFFGAILPGVAALGALPTLGASLALLGGYPVSALRVYRDVRRRGRSANDALAAGVLLTLGKFAELGGMLRFHGRKLGRRERTLIEYKR